MKRGFIKAIILIVIALIVLGYFGYNMEDIVKNPLVKKNLEAFWNFIVFLWNTFLAEPAKFIWDKIIVGILWNGIQNIISAGSHPAVQ